MTVADMIVLLQQGLEDPDQIPFVSKEIKQLEDERHDPGEDTAQQSAVELIEHAHQALEQSSPLTPRGIRTRLEAIHLLDQWYAPLNGTRRVRSADLLEDYARLLDLGRLNEDESLGSVIPKQPRWGLHSVDTELEAAREEAWDESCCRCPDLVNSILSQVSLVPLTLTADDPDGGRTGSRMVAVRYRMHDGIRRKLLPADDRHIRIAFAPLAESATEIALDFPGEREGRWWYNVTPADLQGRILEIFHQMRAAGAHIVVFPECTIRHDFLPELRATVRRQAKGSSILLVVAGISEPAADKDSRSHNYVVVLDEFGDVVLHHQKLMRWNLRKQDRDNFGLICNGIPDGESLYENIRPGEKLEIVELPGLARLMVLICADMSANEPADWLRRNILLDWTFVPLLDSSTELPRWIGADSERAARIARSRVIVANSMSLQHQYLATNGGMAAEAGVALFMDGRAAPLRYAVTRLPLDGHPDKWEARGWDQHAWAPVPPPWHEHWFRGQPPSHQAVVRCQDCRWFGRADQPVAE